MSEVKADRKRQRSRSGKSDRKTAAAFRPRGEGEREKPLLQWKNREEQQAKDERVKEGKEHWRKDGGRGRSWKPEMQELYARCTVLIYKPGIVSLQALK